MSTPQATTLNAIDFPLWGSRLIEASAGTGKTWTIAALYLRLVLGHGGDAACARPLAPAEILVLGCGARAIFKLPAADRTDEIGRELRCGEARAEILRLRL